ncbi:multidrug effflux MFS transporter [Klenkia terrae]|uniref:Multidrug effflux MFS transporter n=1 Tax=Klenkia terrae TaxID=1052259 RepID=A0ABU8E5Y3_9ACTN
MVLLGALSAFGPLSMDLYLPALPSLEAEFGAGQGAVQLTLTSVAVGLAVGQLVAGPLSDRFGRKVPVLVGVGAYALASVLCALAPSVWLLVGIRLLQGLAGAAGIVLARAVVRDRTEGTEAARAFALLASIGGAAPVLAPVLGGQLLRVTDWRGVFGVLALIGLVLLVAARWLPETLPAERRVRGGARATVRATRELVGRRAFRTAVLAQGLGFAALFTYISTSSFVLQTGYGLTPVQFSLVFAVNGAGIVAAGQLSRVLVARLGPRTLLVGGLAAQVAGGVGLVVTALADGGLPVLLPVLFVVVAATGLVLPNATALAMADAAGAAGTASALVGVGQFAVAGAIAPLAGLGAAGALLPMAAVMAGASVLGLVAGLRVPRAAGTPPRPLPD